MENVLNQKENISCSNDSGCVICSYTTYIIIIYDLLKHKQALTHIFGSPSKYTVCLTHVLTLAGLVCFPRIAMHKVKVVFLKALKCQLKISWKFQLLIEILVQ